MGVSLKKTRTSSLIVDFFFIAVFLATITEIFTFVLKGLFVGKVISLADEAFTVGLLLYTCLTRSKFCQRNTLIAVVCFSFVGLLGNLLCNTGVKPALLGLFNTLKPILVFWCFAQYDFEWVDFSRLMKRFCFFFPIIALSYIADFFTPEFRRFLGYGIGESRGGFRSLGGLFVKQTNGTLWLLVYFIYYRYYASTKHKWKSWLSVMFILASIKVKDILGVLIGVSLTVAKKLKASYFLVIVPLVMLLFFLYSMLLPQHYAEYFEGDSKNTKIARVALNQTSLLIGKDYFPLGVGFGQFGSPTSSDCESKVYHLYGIDRVWGLTGDKNDVNFMYDTFWPMILGETGFLGMLMYILILYFAFSPFLKRFCISTNDKLVLFPSLLFVIFLVESMGKPVFSGPPHSFVLWGIAGIFYSLSKKTYTKDFL